MREDLIVYLTLSKFTLSADGIWSVIVLIISVALFIFYLQQTCERILRREFHHEFFHAVVNANRLEFPFLRKVLEGFDVPVDYPRFRILLYCDFLILTYLLKNVCNPRRRLSNDERLLWIYFRSLFLMFIMAHKLRFNERVVILELTAILEYFANVVGERLNRIRFGDMTGSDYLMGL
jgi:hypothetical protein